MARWQVLRAATAWNLILCLYDMQLTPLCSQLFWIQQRQGISHDHDPIPGKLWWSEISWTEEDVCSDTMRYYALRNSDLSWLEVNKLMRMNGVRITRNCNISHRNSFRFNHSRIIHAHYIRHRAPRHQGRVWSVVWLSDVLFALS